jgi:hypothetical protein
MWGTSQHLSTAAKTLRERFPKPTEGTESSELPVEVDILVCQANQEEGTYDGIDWGAERAVEEVSCIHVLLYIVIDGRYCRR